MQRTSRRDFLKKSATVAGAIAGAGALGSSSTKAVVASGQNSPLNADVYVDALVIGSGFGGSIAALRLAQKGVNTMVIERGRRWPILPGGNTFSKFVNPDGRSSWLSTTANGLVATPINKYAGVLELITSSTPGPIRANGVQIRNGAGVGGGSLAYNAIMLQPRRELFDQVFMGQVPYYEMAQTYYPRVRSMLGQATIPSDVLNTSYYSSTRANLQQAQNARMYQGTMVEMNVDFNIVRQEIAGTNVPSAIDGESWYGMNSGAKNSTDHNYLRLAELTGKVQVKPLHIVSDVAEVTPGALYRVTADEIDENGTLIGQRTFTCKYLFMAAGATGTPALLTKARTKGTMPRLPSQVGTDWGGNGDFIASRGGLGSFIPAQGGPSGHILFEDFTNRNSLMSPASNTKYIPTNMVELVLPKDFWQISLGSAPGQALYVGLGLAPALGTFSYDLGTNTTTLNWPNLDPRLARFSQGVNDMLNRLNAANPGSYTTFNSEDPGYKSSGGPALTAHPVGGAVMGKVCDTYGRVNNHPGLYILDGSILPGGSAGGVNPAWTIAALAERSMDKIVANDIH